MKRILPILLLLAVSATAAEFKSFWLTEAVSGRTLGPIVNKPGNRFSLDGREWIVMQSRSGEINFADAATLAPEGPYDLVEQRMVDLGPASYVFTRIVDFEGDDPSADRSVVSQASRAPAEKGRHPWSQDLPERWVLGPVPTTNPGAYKKMAEPWTLEPLELSPEVVAFAEPFRRVQYDWKLDGRAGSRKQALKMMRAGVAGEWKGLSAEAGLAMSGKTSGTLVEDSLAVSGLGLHDGHGLFLAAAYDYRFRIDGGWSASVGAYGAYERTTVDVHARTAWAEAKSPATAAAVSAAEAEGEEPSAVVADYGFYAWGSDFTLSEARLGAAVSLRYDEWYWGLGATFRIDCFDNVSSDGSVPVIDERQSIDADRSQPVTLLFTGWYSPAENWVFEGHVAFGGETTLRIGTGFFF
jgi:hypothetical protein